MTEEVTNDNTPIPQIDPIVDFLSRVKIGDEILYELDSCAQSQEKYEKYFKATDLFVLHSILGNVRSYTKDDPNDPNYVAFNNLIKWMMIMIASNPWWHRKLCYFNRMMGVNMNSTSYWHLQYHPYYIPGQHWEENLDMPKKDFNDSQMTQEQIYAWIDNELENHQE